MTSLDYTDIQQGVFFKLDGTVYETISSVFSKKSRQKGSNQVRIKNVTTGALLTKTLRTSDTLESVTPKKEDYVFVYVRGNEAVIHPVGEPSKRISVDADLLPSSTLLPAGTPVTALVEDETILTLMPPIKIALRVTEAAPGVRGNTAQGGTKRVTVETGASIATPLFIEVGDCIRVNLTTGAYVERA